MLGGALHPPWRYAHRPHPVRPRRAVSPLEDTVAAWNVCAARKTAWRRAGRLWNLRAAPGADAAFLASLDGFATVIGNLRLVPAWRHPRKPSCRAILERGRRQVRPAANVFFVSQGAIA
jgi:hypothetical protein